MNRSCGSLLGAYAAAAVLSAVPASALAAQGVAERAALHQFRDSLAGSRDATALGLLEAQAVDSARLHRDDALLHLRIGLIALRRGDITREGSRYTAAGSEFSWAQELHPDWPYPWYGLGLAEAGEGETTWAVLAALFGKSPLLRAADDLAKSARLDPTFTDGLVDPVMIGLARGDATLQHIALGAAREAAGLPAAQRPDVRLARALIEREVGDPDSALAVLDELLAAEPRNAAALFELGRTRLEVGRLDGAEVWYRGLALADSVTLSHYRNDVAILLPDSTLRAFDTAANGTARALLLRHFWEARDELQSSSERLREHYRRLEVARRSYAVVEHGDRNNLPALLDDRGVIYVRHGAPANRASLSLIGVPPNESWEYHRTAGPDLLFHFVRRDGDVAYRLVPSVFDILALSNEAKIAGKGPDRRSADSRTDTVETYGAGLLAQTAEELLHSREPISPIYGKMLSEGKRGAASLQAEERAAGNKSLAIGLTTDSWKMGFELPLPAKVELVAIGSDSGGSELQVAFAIPGDAIIPQRTAQGFLYTVRMRAAISAADGTVITSVDTTRGFMSQSWLAGDGQLLGRLPIEVPPGAYTARVALESESGGLVTPRQAIVIASFAGPGLGLSDLALGVRTVPLAWRPAGTDTAWIEPSRTFKRNEPMQLLFEVGGLPAGTPYRAELTVVKTSSKAAAKVLEQPELKGDAMMRLGFDERHGGGIVAIHREVSLEKLNPGEYIIEVVVSTPDGIKAVRRREFTIVK